MDRKSTVLSIILPPLMVASFVIGYFFPGQHARGATGDPSAKVREVKQKIDAYFYGELKDEDFEKAAINGVIAKLDPYCEYFTTEDWKDFNEKFLKGQFGGVGILVEPDTETGYMRVQTPLEDTPAFAADIVPNDLILEVDGVNIKGQTITDVIKRIKGAEGTKVVLTMGRKGREAFKVTLVRAQITVKAVKEKMLENGIGYIRITDFTEMMPQWDAAVEKLKQQGMKALIVDLRHNGGGLLDQCVKLSDRFLPKGQLIVTTKSKVGDIEKRESEDDSKDVGDLPLVILVNGGTASASEIFAGCMKDHHRGVLVGAKTYGKGSVQTPFELADKSRLKITTARYFTPSGYSVHKIPGQREYGLEPDYLIELTDEEILNVQRKWSEERIVKSSDPQPSKVPAGFIDYQMKAAIEVLDAKLAGREPKVDKRELSSLKKPEQPK